MRGIERALLLVLRIRQFAFPRGRQTRRRRQDGNEDTGARVDDLLGEDQRRLLYIRLPTRGDPQSTT